jgi:hypothetical protein
MSFGGSGGGGGTVSGSTDVVLNSIAGNQGLVWNAGTSKWTNVGVAQSVGGGVEGLVALGSKTSATTLSLANGNVISITIGASLTLTFPTTTASTACSFGLYVTYSGSYNITWPSNTTLKWSGGTAPTQSSSNGQTDIYVFETINGGTTWYGSQVGANFS